MTIQFPDLSHYKPVPLDGAVALITKGTQGATYVDPTFVPFRADATRRGIPFAGYHWVDNSDLGAQARNAWRVMGSTPVMWDAEAAGVTVPRLLDLTAKHRALGGNPTLCYLPRWWWRDHMGSPDLRPLAEAGLSLVSSAYPSTGYSDNGVGWQPYGGVTPAIWQFTDAKPFNGQKVDFNAYKGTVEQLRALFNGAPKPGGENVMAVIVAWPPDVKGSLCFSNGSSLRHIPNETALGQIKRGWPGIQTVLDAAKWPAEVVHQLYGPDGPPWGAEPEPPTTPDEVAMVAIATRVARETVAESTLTPPG